MLNESGGNETRLWKDKANVPVKNLIVLGILMTCFYVIDGVVRARTTC